MLIILDSASNKEYLKMGVENALLFYEDIEWWAQEGTDEPI